MAQHQPRTCPYSTDTVVACPRYAAAAPHASWPGAEHCRHIVVEQRGPVRRLRCTRNSETPAPVVSLTGIVRPSWPSKAAAVSLRSDSRPSC
jgi:hypothetical protein